MFVLILFDVETSWLLSVSSWVATTGSICVVRRRWRRSRWTRLTLSRRLDVVRRIGPEFVVSVLALTWRPYADVGRQSLEKGYITSFTVLDIQHLAYNPKNGCARFPEQE